MQDEVVILSFLGNFLTFGNRKSDFKNLPTNGAEMASQVSILYPVAAVVLLLKKSLVWKSTEPQNNSQCGFIKTLAHVEVRQFSDLLILISMRAIFDQVTCFLW